MPDPADLFWSSGMVPWSCFTAGSQGRLFFIVIIISGGDDDSNYSSSRIRGGKGSSIIISVRLFVFVFFLVPLCSPLCVHKGTHTRTKSTPDEQRQLVFFMLS